MFSDFGGFEVWGDARDDDDEEDGDDDEDGDDGLTSLGHGRRGEAVAASMGGGFLHINSVITRGPSLSILFLTTEGLFKLRNVVSSS